LYLKMNKISEKRKFITKCSRKIAWEKIFKNDWDKKLTHTNNGYFT
jgi:hypothetical protein